MNEQYDVKQKYSELLNSTAFKDWAKENKDHKLKICFFMKSASDDQINWSFSFVSGDKLHTFEVSDDIKYVGCDEVYVENKDEEFNLDLSQLKKGYLDIKAAISDALKGFDITKEICTISNNKSSGFHWNLSEVTSNLKILNFKIDAEGTILDQKEMDLLKLGKWLKKDDSTDYIG